MKLDMRLTTATVLLWIVMLPIFSFIHEYGHAIVCEYYGYEAQYHLSFLSNAVSCHGNLSENPGFQSTFRMAGGFLAASISLSAFALLKNYFTRKTRFIAIVLVVIGITHFYNMTVETWFNDYYINYSSINSMVNTMGALVMLFFLIKRHSPEMPSIKAIQHTKETINQAKKTVPQNVFQRSIVDIIKRTPPTPVERSDEYEKYMEKQNDSLASLDLVDAEFEEEEDE